MGVETELVDDGNRAEGEELSSAGEEKRNAKNVAVELPHDHIDANDQQKSRGILEIARGNHTKWKKNDVDKTIEKFFTGAEPERNRNYKIQELTSLASDASQITIESIALNFKYFVNSRANDLEHILGFVDTHCDKIVSLFENPYGYFIRNIRYSTKEINLLAMKSLFLNGYFCKQQEFFSNLWSASWNHTAVVSYTYLYFYTNCYPVSLTAVSTDFSFVQLMRDGHNLRSLCSVINALTLLTRVPIRTNAFFRERPILQSLICSILAFYSILFLCRRFTSFDQFVTKLILLETDGPSLSKWLEITPITMGVHSIPLMTVFYHSANLLGYPQIIHSVGYRFSQLVRIQIMLRFAEMYASWIYYLRIIHLVISTIWCDHLTQATLRMLESCESGTERYFPPPDTVSQTLLMLLASCLGSKRLLGIANTEVQGAANMIDHTRNQCNFSELMKYYILITYDRVTLYSPQMLRLIALPDPISQISKDISPWYDYLTIELSKVIIISAGASLLKCFSVKKETYFTVFIPCLIAYIIKLSAAQSAAYIDVTLIEYYDRKITAVTLITVFFVENYLLATHTDMEIDGEVKIVLIFVFKMIKFTLIKIGLYLVIYTNYRWLYRKLLPYLFHKRKSVADGARGNEKSVVRNSELPDTPRKFFIEKLVLNKRRLLYLVKK